MRSRALIAAACAAILSACGQTDSEADNAAAPSETDNRKETAMTERAPTASAAFAAALDLTPPDIEKRPVEITQHDITRVDNYAWLRDEGWQEVLRDPSQLDDDIRAALDVENEYYKTATADLDELRNALFAEMRGRIKEDDADVPSKDGDWKYWKRFREGGEYPVFVRAPAAGGEEEILYDGDKEGEGVEFFNIGDVSHSPDHRLIAYAVDRLGSEYYSIRVRNLETGEEFDETIESADSIGAVWTADSSAFYYIERDDNQRPKRVKLHRLGTSASEDRLIYEEPDDGFFMSVSKSQSGEYIFIYSGSHTSSEVRYLPADALDAEPVLIEPRAENVEYSVAHHGEHFYILTNADDAVDFKVARAPVASPARANWEDWVAHEAGTYILTIIPFKDYFVRLERSNALPRIIVSTYDGEERAVTFDEAAYSLGVDAGYEFDTTTLRFTYESPSTSEQTYDYDMADLSRELLKTQEVPSGHDASLYAVERIMAPAADGAEIPVTILRLKSSPMDGSAPVLLYGYGSYGATIPANFSTSMLSMVDRGVTFALAHIRGGAAKGRQWYLDGKRDKKMNTFTDFNSAADALIAEGYTSQQNIVIYGGSAGGLLVGASVNLRPELYAGVIAAVPFVDVINTISDATLPLTPPEWDEWGNPIESAEEYGWIADYSPYDNIKAETYPPIMATGGLTDYRVTYWEPAKWIPRLRDEAQGGPFVLRMNMGAGHGGSAARFERLEERAHLYAFALKALGMEGAEPVSHGGE